MKRQLRGFYLEDQRFEGRENNKEMLIKLKTSVNEQEQKELLSNIYKANIGLISYYLNKKIFGLDKLLMSYKITYDDLFSIASFGLYKAIKAFNIEKNTNFATFSTRVISNEINMYIRKFKNSTKDTSIEKSINIDSDGNELTFMDITPDENNEYDEVEEELDKEFNRRFIDIFKESLSPRDRQVIELRFYEDKTQKETSEILGISQSYISRLVTTICKKGNKLYKKIEKGGVNMNVALSKIKMPQAEIKELIAKSQSGCFKSREKLVESNLRLAMSVVTKRFSNRGIDVEDLFQIGVIGLIKSIDKFDLSFDVNFSTYAVPMITGEIQRFLRDDGLIRVSRTTKEKFKVIRIANEKFIHENGRPATHEEIAKILKMDSQDYFFILEALRPIKSIYETIFENDGDPIALIDQITNNEDIINFDNIVLKEFVKELKDREKFIIEQRYFHDKTQSEVASCLGLSQVQVSRIEKKVLSDLKDSFNDINKPKIYPSLSIPKIIKPVIMKEPIIIIEVKEKEIVDMAEFKSKKESVFELLDKKYKKPRIMKESSISAASYYNYLSLYKKAKEHGEWPIDGKVSEEPKAKVEYSPIKNKVADPKILLVDIVLMDGTVIESCGIFRLKDDNIPTNGDRPIQNMDDIKEIFQKVPWGRKTICFQTKYMNGYTDAAHVKEYEIKQYDEIEQTV